MTLIHDSIDAGAFETAPARLTIKLDHVVANWRSLCRLSGRARTLAVVKANAYGLGMAEIAPALANAGCADFFVATLAEAKALRKIAPEARIFILTGLWQGQQQEIADNRLIPVLGSLEQLSLFLAMGRPDLPFALGVETGMNRLGLPVDDAMRLAFDPRFSTRFQPCLVMSHLACGDHRDHKMNGTQLEAFLHVATAFKGAESSFSASAGIFLGPDFHFDLTRPGYALYGGNPVSGATNPMLPTVTAEARILQVRSVKAGETVSYGATHRFVEDGRIAIVAGGYGDGWQRALSGSGVAAREDGSPGAHGVVKGFAVPVIGRITMDMSVFDISAVPENYVGAGDYIELFGEYMSLENAARAAGTIGYEMLTSLGHRYSRRYIR